MKKPLVNKKYLLEKYPGKGGWTYAAIPEVLQDKHSPFGWVKVRGKIDSFEISNYKLMPMGNGTLFLPVRAEIRKAIGKKEGDYVQVILYADPSPKSITKELKECFQEEPGALENFLSHPKFEQEAILDWIYSAKSEEDKVIRISKTIEKLLQLK